ncbi:MAG TPA: hypothetical protein VJT09_03190 [Pyrinomonadaceae bacterium]|nr:hypothetical protein [Pyrinomonadaceae bacterium]
MPSTTLERLLIRLDELKRRFDEHSPALALKVLARLERQRFTDANPLVRFHEILLFMRAYPQNARVLKRVEKILNTFARRVRALEEQGADLSPLEAGEVSGIAGTFVEDTFSYQITRWLIRRDPSHVSIDWAAHEDEYRLAATLPRFLPLLEEDALVEANVPYPDWIRAARGRARGELAWLIECFERWPLSEKEKAELYESLKLYVRWDLGNSRATRTLMKRPVREVFYHAGPLLARRDVSFEREFGGPPLRPEKLTRTEGQAVLDLARETSTVRYRELYGFTHGDAARVIRADLGRGVEIFLVGVPPERRLPLRAYHAGLIFKNGVAVCYVETLSLFERMEVGFNLYYTFREGESAWIYARVLKLLRQLLGVSAFSIDPYQVGHENEEGIESGAFWFYRKLGFRPTLSRVAKILEGEERRLAKRPAYRTPHGILRSLAEGHMILDTTPEALGRWDRFRIRNVGLAVQRRMASHFNGDAIRMRRACVERIARALGVRVKNWKEAERRAFADFAVVLALIPDLSRWTKEEKESIASIIRAKAGADESRYVRLLQRHPRLRDEIIRIGS